MIRAMRASRVPGRPGRRRPEYLPEIAILIALAAALGFFLLSRWANSPQVILAMGQSHAIHSTLVRQRSSLDAPVVEALRPSRTVIVMHYLTDPPGNCWFQLSEQDGAGYVLCRDMAPPKVTDADNGFGALEQWLIAVKEPGELPQGAMAIRDYSRRFPTSPHTEELMRLLAQRTRELSKDGTRQPATERTNGEQHRKIVRQNSKFLPRQLVSRPA